MSFSRLLLVAASSKKYIEGEKDSKIFIKPGKENLPSGRDIYEGEVILCFQLDERRDGRGKQVARSLGIVTDDKRCDGLIFYTNDATQERVICLVEMKHKNIDKVVNQIKDTKEVIEKLLEDECRSTCSKELSRVKWKACFYRYGSSPEDVQSVKKQLSGFSDIADFTLNDNDAGPFLRGQTSAKASAEKLRGRNKHR